MDTLKELNKSRLDLACGDNKVSEDFCGVDVVDIPGVDIVHDLTVYPWPFEDNSVEEIYCSHYIEHIPHVDALSEIKTILTECSSFDEFKSKVETLPYVKDGFIRFMNEVYRILKPGGKIKIISPYVTNIRAFGDPTHTRYIHDWSFYYFNKEWRDVNKLSHYGIDGDFDVKFSYFIDDSLALKSNEVREEAFKKDWNSILDIIVELTKREKNET